MTSSGRRTHTVHSSSSKVSGTRLLLSDAPSSNTPVPPLALLTQLASRGVKRVQSNTYLRLSLPRIPFISVGPHDLIVLFITSTSSSLVVSFSGTNGVVLYFLIISTRSSVRGRAKMVRVDTMHPSPMQLSMSLCISSSQWSSCNASTAP